MRLQHPSECCVPLDGIVKNYQILQAALGEIQLGHDEYAAKASGLLARMEIFDTYFALKLAYLVFSSAEQLSVNLQAVDITIQEALKGAELLITHLKSLRNDACFDRFYDAIYQDSKDLTEGRAHQYEEPKARYRHAYFETLELAAEVEKRFDHEDIRTIKEIETLLLKAGNRETVDSVFTHPELFEKRY